MAAPHHRVGRVRAGLHLVAALTCGYLVTASPEVLAQVAVSGRGKNFVAPVTDAQGRKSVLRGKDVRPAGRGMVEITGMQAETFRGQEKDLIVEAPKCVFDTKANQAYSPGTLSIRTADERFSIEGEGFQWQLGDSRLNSKLVISNQVHSLVRKRAVPLKPGAGGSVASPAGSSTATSTAERAGGTNDVVRITSRQFEYQSDRAIYRGDVRVLDPEGDLSCGVLVVLFRGDGGVLERIEAEEQVELTQGNTRAKSDRAVYTVGEDQDLLEFMGHAAWQDGDRAGSGERLTFDRRNRLLRSEEKAYLRVPRAVLGSTGLFPAEETPARPGTNAPPSFVEVFSDMIAIQLPATNGPVQRIVAEKNVLIVDAGQDGRALADRAVYEDATGILELTGSPLMETERRLVNGRTLRFDRATRTFTAGPDAYVKLPFVAVLEMGLLPTQPPAVRGSGQTNQFVEIWSRNLSYQTNRLHFDSDVRANFLEGNVVLGQLTCRSLTVEYAGRLQSILAEGEVEFQQQPLPDDPTHLTRKVTCDRLRARFNAAGRLEMALADSGVDAEQSELRPGRPQPVLSKLRSETVTAYFSGVTNRLERVLAERGVVFAQDGRVARGAKAVYEERQGTVELTGDPVATMPEGQIQQAERLIWDRTSGRFIGKGLFKSGWKQPPGASNHVSRATSASR